MTVTQSVLGDFADTGAGALLPCTSTQTGMVFETITRSPAVYLEQIVVRLREHVDARCMQEAWTRLAARHDAMRLSFEIGQATSLRQRVAPTVRVPFVERDWRRLEPFEQEKRWRDLLRADRQGGFALESAPLFRVTLCQIADADFRMLFTHHHAIIDGYAGVTVQLELFAIYDSLRAGAEINLPEPDSFQSFVEWASLQSADEKGIDFWRAALAGIEEPTPAPIGDDDDREGSAGVAEVRLGTELSARLEDFCARCEMSLATVMQGAFAVLLSQEVAQDDLLYATTRAGRRSPPMDTDRMVGVLMVASPVRLRMSRELSFQDLLVQIRELSLAVRAFEHMPISEIRRVSEVPSTRPFTEVLFNFQPHTATTALRILDSSWADREVELYDRTGQALTLNIFGDDDILLQTAWDGVRCRASAGRRFVNHLAALLDELAESEPTIAIGDLGAMPATQLRVLSGELDDPLPAEIGLIPTLFAEKVAAHPDRVALVHEGDQLTYAELDARVDAIAAMLVDRGVGYEEHVGIATRRSVDMVAAVLATHRVGAAYVPLDPRYPSQRLRFMMADSGARVVITDPASASSLPAGVSEQIVLDGELPTAPRAIRPASIRPDTLSHVIYTSGSTGTPKGVMVEQGSVAALADWARDTFSDAQRDGVLASTSLSFDLSVFELIVTLALGGSVVLVEDLFALADTSFDAPISLINSVPSLITQLLQVRALPDSVRTVTLAGEALPRTLVNRLFEQPGVEAVWNLYGPSEDTTYSTAARCDRDDTGAPSIGRPLPGTQVYVVSPALRPVPPGVCGELLLGGAGLARGYHDRPELTAERFIPNPFGDPSARLYRTGDRVSWRADGMLDYHGRLDDQVKLRGFRIEPGEVRHALLEDPDIEDAAVLVRSEQGDRKLVAYVVGRTATIDPQETRQRLAASLPAHLVPASVVVLDSLPLTPSGKLDRDSLPAPRAAAASSGLTGATERAMGALWQEVLELEAPPGADDDFFALGADSFDALALLAGIEARFGRWLGAAAMLESTTLADMVARLDLERRQQSMSPVIPVRDSGSRPPWFFAVADHRAVIAMRNVLPTLMYDQPVYAVHTIDPASPGWRMSSVEAITEKCLSAIREHQPHGPYRLGGYSLGGYVGWELACRLQDMGEEVELLVLLDTFAPYAFSWRGQTLIRGREGRGYPVRRRVRGYGGLLRERVQHRLSLLRRPPAPQLYSQDFDERWDHPGAIRLARRYRPRPFAGPVVVYYTDYSARVSDEPTLWWERHASGTLEAEWVPGDHHSVLAASQVATFSGLLAERLERLDSERQQHERDD